MKLVFTNFVSLYNFHSKLRIIFFCRYFESPKPPLDIVQNYVDNLRVTLLETLRHKGAVLSVSLEFRHNIFKHLFYGKGKIPEERNWMLYEKNDFVRCKLPDKWSCLYDQHGDEPRINFPIKMRTFLTQSPKTYHRVNDVIAEVSTAYTEKNSIRFIEITASCN